MKIRRAFTILELLIVIAIITIIFSAMAINVTSLQNEAKISRAQGDLKTLQIAIESYYKNYMYEFPAEDNYQRTLLESTPRVLESNLIDCFGATSISLYKYTLSPNGSYYIVHSLGISRRGEARVGNAGIISVERDPIWATNGHL
jgi:prepilin-type N-terminal cleavage/methylation domain-containing protein